MLIQIIQDPYRGAAWRWGALLAFALFAPVGLPAGGADPKQPVLRRRESSRDPLLTLEPSALRAFPHSHAPRLNSLQPGDPVDVLRGWSSPSGRQWLKVEVRSCDCLDSRRGWIPVA
jgi:hypothetical protein